MALVDARTMILRLSQPLVLALIVAALLCACPGRQPARPETLSTVHLSPEMVEPFKSTHIDDIKGNVMHEKHFAGGAMCGQCHLSTNPLPVTTAHEICKNCHPEQTVKAPVWQSHCLSCHHFTHDTQQAEGNPQLIELLCVKCHPDRPADRQFLAFCDPEAAHEVLCVRCHDPHKSAAVAQPEVCAECHPEHTKKAHPYAIQGQCSICHSPHRKSVSGFLQCQTCHGQAEGVMVHSFSVHPKDCLECHKAHFTKFELTGNCKECHQGKTYNGGPSQPAKHFDCTSCHNSGSFKFKGSAACAGCHKTQGAVLSNEGAPKEHQSCTRCHAQHTWTASRKSCTKCHSAGAPQTVFEHTLPFHQVSCGACHDPHLARQLPASGNCSECHKSPEFPAFDVAGPELHRECTNCHATESIDARQFEFVGAENSCQVCHATAQTEPEVSWDAAPAGHTECLACHAPHKWAQRPSSESCAICHSDVVAAAPNPLHAECSSCHMSNHLMPFAGEENSCQVCHGDVIAAAPNAMHQQCSNCHALNHTVAFAGVENSCQVCHSDVVAEAPNELHQQCDNCHTLDHGMAFVGAENSCAICHSERSGLHTAAGHQDCTNCHTSHTFKPDTSSCTVCHTDRAEHFPGQECLGCHKFK